MDCQTRAGEVPAATGCSFGRLMFIFRSLMVSFAVRKSEGSNEDWSHAERGALSGESAGGRAGEGLRRAGRAAGLGGVAGDSYGGNGVGELELCAGPGATGVSGEAVGY